MKRKFIIIGLICELIACLYVPMRGHYMGGFQFLGYNWIWSEFTNDYMSNPDIPRLIVGMFAIALLTAICYFIY